MQNNQNSKCTISSLSLFNINILAAGLVYHKKKSKQANKKQENTCTLTQKLDNFNLILL